MSRDVLSKEDLIAAGWKSRQIDAALDDPDETGPSGHWMNKSGKPFYLRERAEVAAYRIGLSPQAPSAEVWDRWKDSERPTSLPLLTFDFHKLAEKCMPGVSREFWSLRLSHPVVGQRPGSETKEAALIERVLLEMTQQAFDVRVGGQAGLSSFLQDRAGMASWSLGPTWPGDVMLRPAYRASYVSKAAGKAHMQKALDALALVRCGQIVSPGGAWAELVDMLQRSPQVRFDRRSLLADIGAVLH